MKKAVIYTFSSLVTFLLITLITLNYTNINFSKNYITQLVNETLGRKLIFNGDLKIQLFPDTGLTAKDIQFENAQWTEKNYLLEAKSINIKISAKALLFGELKITKIILDGFIINLEKNDLNKANWEFPILEEQEQTNSKATPKTDTILPFYKGSKLGLTDIEINYKDKNIEKRIYIEELLIEQNKYTKIKLLAKHKNIPVNLNLQIPPLKDLLNLQLIPIIAKGNIENIYFNVKTDIPLNPDTPLKVLFDIDFDNLSTIKKMMPIKTADKLPKIGKVSLSAILVKDKQNIILKFSKGEIGTSSFHGKFIYNTQSDRPKITSQLKIKSLNLKTAEKPPTKKTASLNQQKNLSALFPSKALPFEYLSLYDADIDIEIDDIKHNILEIEKFIIQAKLNDGLLKINKLYIKNDRNEVINAKIRINAKLAQPKINIIIVTENIQLDKNDALKEYLSGANTNVKINLDSKGKSIQEIMGHLNGQIIVKVGKGKLDDELLKFISSNILTDLVKAINPIADKSTTTNLECAAVRFDIKEGVLTADKGIVMQTDKIQIISSGIIDLHTEILEFGIRPQAREGVELNLNSLASMVKLSGKIIDPGITMSVKDTAVVYSYFATGGATFLAKSLYDTATRDNAPCKTAVLGPTD